MDACCCLDIEDLVTPMTREWRRARKPHACGECGAEMSCGEKYFYETYIHYSQYYTHKTCWFCNKIREDFFPCGWNYGALRKDFYDCNGWDYLGEWHDEAEG